MSKTPVNKSPRNGLSKWDEAIQDASEKIKRLKFSIKIFEQKKMAGEKWSTEVTSNK
jgi:hypothetical protein